MINAVRLLLTTRDVRPSMMNSVRPSMMMAVPAVDDMTGRAAVDDDGGCDRQLRIPIFSSRI